jgi:GAF domain-containing protein
VAPDFERASRDRLLESIREVFESLLNEESLDTTVQRVVELAQWTIPECQHASITRGGRNGAYTANTTSTVATEIDHAQYASNRGPCLDALREQRTVSVARTDEPGEYEEFGRCAIERGVRSSLSVPLAVRGEAVGALNLYSHEEDGFGAGTELAETFGQQVAVAISAANLHEQTRQLVIGLRHALESREAIGQATGILMASGRLTRDAAFDALVKASQDANRKLRDIADEVTRTGGLPNH